MRKVEAKPLLADVVAIPELLKTLVRLHDFLLNIQKALIDYLEQQRREFARFYFVGDEDLLEIIGNSKEVAIVQKHFPKMYAGIQVLQFRREAARSVLEGMVSKEAE